MTMDKMQKINDMKMGIAFVNQLLLFVVILGKLYQEIFLTVSILYKNKFHYEKKLVICSF
ncbi:hypothetical protein A2382_01570 [Candidatus Woesebacteria bacterium RIFOXYB1_FULL_38_16]|uniref:Uncharacterized protein n=1 Tax=Candidatus Woesebacteria bacterium RIFOXYB1_FULL_38_16 TaxID=1802538 RepID=A0A1F8CUU7_9BACT|nr:MAG: hypothetical protein A2191_03155 [Candidatus Woesebacteria bacterium RIFOXYA1_FULL_38_9]OGM80113.1 MAG: hypothetical protein A2382_01570 [Candidatus Woesebacteria bacterium RIFOXYB1_FULL_38_16]